MDRELQSLRQDDIRGGVANGKSAGVQGNNRGVINEGIFSQGDRCILTDGQIKVDRNLVININRGFNAS